MYASLQVDLGRLRPALDELRKALATRGPVQTGTAAAFSSVDQVKLLAALKLVLEKATQDQLGRLNDQRAGSALGRTYRDPALLTRLKGALGALSKASSERVGGKLGAEKVAILGKLLQKPTPDFLSVVQRTDDENAHSDFIRWLLSPRKAPNIAAAALFALVGGLDDAEAWRTHISNAIKTRTLAVRREYVFGREWEDSDELYRLDLFISGPGFALAIENKLWSSEHEDQTIRYWEWLRSVSGLRAGLFLTPNGQSAQCSHFKSISYLGLLSALLEGSSQGAISEREELVLASYVKSLGASALRRELQMIEREAL